MTDKHPPEPPASTTSRGEEMIEKEKYLRLAADFDNYRKRMESELADTAKFGSSRVVQEMVDVMDHLDHAVRHAPPEVIASAEWFKGLRQTDKQFLETVKKFGITRIVTVGQRFDPVTMEAISMVPGGESQKVKEEIRSGYIMHERVIRPARVIIYE
jgi:molecular chaperone GrpE